MIATLKAWLDSAKDESAKQIINYLAKRADEDEGLAEDIEGKEWSECEKYIREQARKQAVNGVACIDDPTVYEWAEDFCRMSAEEVEKLKPKANTASKPKIEKRNTKNTAPKQKTSSAKAKPKPNVVNLFDIDEDNGNNDELSLFDEEEEQISLF